MSYIQQAPGIFADGSTWTATGLSVTGSYTTASTPMFNLSPTWNFSSTSNGLSSIGLTPTLVPTGATFGNVQGVNASTTLGTSSVNGGDLRGFNAGLTLSAGYTGTLATAIGAQFNLTNSGAAQLTARTVFAGYPSNGAGATSGSISNAVFSTGPTSVVSAGSGGTVTNSGLRVELNGGSGAGTTNNRGVYITGNGGSGGGGTTNNYAIYSDSTAPSLLSGTLILPAGATGASSMRLPHGAAPSAPVNGDMWTTTSGLFVRINGSTVGPLT